jgi:predicted HTH transcriptional regulator
MFAEQPEKFIPYAYVEVIREVVGTDKMESRSFKGPVWIQTQRVRDYFRDTIMASYTVREPGKPGAHRVFNWPLEMFEELATNCILHKEYSRKQYIGIYVYRDHLSFINHNRPVPPVTIADLNEKVVFDDRRYLNDELKDMFFKLDLIQSYGSGIRRAKKAMEDNGSPKLVFSPDNDTDDYTQAVAYINAEFAKIREEEEQGRSVNTQETTKETTNETTKKTTREKIVEYLRMNPKLTAKELSEKLEISSDGVRYHLNQMKKDGVIHREGPDKGGSWIVN